MTAYSRIGKDNMIVLGNIISMFHHQLIIRFDGYPFKGVRIDPRRQSGPKSVIDAARIAIADHQDGFGI